MKKGWSINNLNQVCDISTGKWDANHASDDGSFRFFTCAREPLLCNTKRFNGECLILPGNGVNVGDVYYYNGDFDAYQRTYVISNIKILPTYLYYHMLAFWRERNLNKQYGSATNFLKIGNFNDYEIPIPPLLEQRRIVGILDQAFAAIATAKANTETNLQNARALFDSELNAIFSARGKGWVEKTFEELVESNVIGLTKSIKEQGDKKAWRYVKMNNITRDNRFDFSSFTKVDATNEEVGRYQLKDGDFLFNTRNSFELVGKSCIYEADSDETVLFNNNIMRVRFAAGIEARFVLYAFSFKAVAEELNALKSGTTNVSAIYYRNLKSLVIPIAPIVEQKQIVNHLDKLAATAQNLESIYWQKLPALEELKKSLLHQAFTGEL